MAWLQTSQPLATPSGLGHSEKSGSAMMPQLQLRSFLGLVRNPASCGRRDIFAFVWDAKTEKLYGSTEVGKSTIINQASTFHDEESSIFLMWSTSSFLFPSCLMVGLPSYKIPGKLPNGHSFYKPCRSTTAEKVSLFL